METRVPPSHVHQLPGGHRLGCMLSLWRLVVTAEGRRDARGSPRKAEDGLLFPGNPHLWGLGLCPQGYSSISSLELGRTPPLTSLAPAFLPIYHSVVG